MRILLITHSYNSLTQRLHGLLSQCGHELSIEFDISDSVSIEAVALFRPDLIVAPYLRRALPESIWRQHCCLIVHPGIVGDRGPSALDWAIQGGESQWGVTVLQAEAEMDAGPVWAQAEFPLRLAKKSSIYREEVTTAACQAVLQAVERYASGSHRPIPLADWPTQVGPVPGQLRPLMRQSDRCIDWQHDSSHQILAHLHAADGFPGVADTLFGEACHLFDAAPEALLRAAPGQQAGDLIARRETAVLRATVDGAVWLGHVKRAGGYKLPATVAFAEASALLPEVPLSNGWWASPHPTWQDIAYEEAGGVGFLHFNFCNGAMGTRQCQRLLEAYRWALQRPTQVVVLMGGVDFWSNGIHLNLIEAAESPADESWANINAIDDLAEAIITTESHLTIAAVGGNTGAGGCFLARAADLLWLRPEVLLNPHYKNMGNLYGSEYWTYLLPPRVGTAQASALMQQRLPLSASAAVAQGFADAVLAATPTAFRVDVARRAAELAAAPDLGQRLAAKRQRRAADEAAKPLAVYRAEELAHMRRNFYGFDPSYHVARYHFVLKSLHSWTPRHLARHRDLGWLPPTEAVVP